MIAIAYFAALFTATAGIEALFALLFRFSRREQRALLIGNAVTNPSINALSVLFYILSSSWPSLYAIAMLELFAVLAEWLIIKRLSGERRFLLLYVFLLNAASFGTGLILFRLLA